MMSAFECVRELLERIAAGVGVDTSVELEADAEGISTEFVSEDLGLVIGHHRGDEAHPFCSTQDLTVPPLDPREGCGKLDCCRRGITPVRGDPDPALPMKA
jgi:hypothetical protein